jgi:hypothetical protein
MAAPGNANEAGISELFGVQLNRRTAKMAAPKVSVAVGSVRAWNSLVRLLR